MMDHVVRHVARACVKAHGVVTSNMRVDSLPDDPNGQAPIEIPFWGAALLATTFIAFILILSSIEYTYGHVIATLSMVESTTAAVFETIPSEDPDAPLDQNKNKLQPLEPELVLIKQAPVTSSLRGTIKYLRDRAGRLSRFRGLSLWVVNGFLFGQLNFIVSRVRYLPDFFSPILVAVILASLRMGWTHIVITEPSSKYWYKRVPSVKLWKKIALPTAVAAICKQIAIALPMLLGFALGLARFNDPQQFADLNSHGRKVVVLKGFAVLLIGIFSAIAIVIPTQVALTRVQASLISEEEETIVPFDRSFGGKVVPAVVGGSGVISMLDAWKTFEWSARVRLIKLYVKVAAMQIFTIVVFTIIMLVQASFIMGDDAKKYAHWAKQSLRV